MCILAMKGEVIFPNPVVVLLKFPIMKQTHPAILCPSVDNWTRIFALSLPTLSSYSSHLPWPEAKSLNLPPGRLAGWCCSSAQPALPCKLLGQSWEFPMCSLLLVAVHGTVILFGSMGRKRCKSRRKVMLDDVLFSGVTATPDQSMSSGNKLI